MVYGVNMVDALLECLSDVAVLLEKANAVTLKQREALVENNAEAITATTKAHEDILRRIGEADYRAASAASEIAAESGLGDDADIDAIAGKLGFPYADMIHKELDRISVLSSRLKEEHEINHRLLRNGLDIIACCLRTVASEQKPNSYSSSAGMQESQASVLSLDLKA